METAPGSTDPFPALVDPTRCTLLMRWRAGERLVRDLLHGIDLTYATDSQHVQILHAAGLLQPRSAGRRRLYRLRSKGMAPVRNWLARAMIFGMTVDRLNDELVQVIQQPGHESDPSGNET